MAQPTTREEFKEFCLRKLGKGVIQINVSDDQVEDRIDEALSYYNDYHFDGSEKVFYKHTITAQDKTNGYIPIPESIIGAINIYNPNNYSFSSSNMFSVEYQFALNNLTELSNFDMSDYFMTKMNIEMMNDMLVGAQPIRYNRHLNKLHIDTNWNRYSVGDVLVVEAYRAVDPDYYSDVWKDRWLQGYATAKIKYQWGSNLMKFPNMQLVGGMQFNGERIYDEAKEEIGKLEEEMIDSYSLPVSDMIG